MKTKDIEKEKFITILLFILFVLSVDSKRTLMLISKKFEMFYKIYPYLFWGLLNLYFIKSYFKYVRKENIKRNIIYIIWYIILNILMYIWYYFWFGNGYVGISAIKIGDLILSII